MHSRVHVVPSLVLSLLVLVPILGFLTALHGQPPCDETDSATVCNVYTNWMIMDPKNVADIFGRRIGKRFVAVQVTVSNVSKDFDFIIHDVAVTLPESLDFSSAELSLLRGVAERGRAADPRNKVLNLLRGAGVIFSAVLGLPVMGVRGSWAAAAAGFNGPLIAGFETIYPDHSINQLVRLSDGAYAANTIVPKGHARVMVAFLPLRLFMSNANQKKFWNEPNQFWGQGDPDLMGTTVEVDGMHVANVAKIPPILTAVIFNPGEVQKFREANAEASGFLLGRFLTGATISIENEDLEGVTVAVRDTPTDERIEFVVMSTEPIESGTVLEFGVAKEGDFRTINERIQYSRAPTLDSVTPSEGAKGETEPAEVVVVLAGSNFIEGETTVLFDGNVLPEGAVERRSASELAVTLTLGPGVATGSHSISVRTSFGVSEAQTFTVTRTP